MVQTSGGYSTTDRGDYTEWHVNSGTRLLVNIEEGDTFENVLFDCSASGASVLLQTYVDRSNPPSSFTVRNIGYSGPFPSGASRPMTVASSGYDCLIENVYLGDGTYGYQDSSYESVGGIWAAPSHSGHITFRRLYLMDWVDNAMYLSAPSWTGNGGTFTVENCYAKHNQISCFRLCGEDEIINCYGETQSGDHRVMWVYENGGTTQIDQCDFNDAGGTYALRVASPATISNSNWNSERVTSTLNDAGGNGSNPSEFIPAGCPTTAEAAAGGEGWDESPSGGDNPERADYDNVLYVDVQDYDDYVTWHADTTSQPVHADYDGATRDGNDYVQDNGDGTWTAGSEAQNYNDAIFFDGSLAALYSEPADTGADFSLNGAAVTPDNWDDSDDGDDGDGGDTPVSDPPSGDAVIGYVRVRYGDGIEILPVFDTEALTYACWRVDTPNGVGAFRLRPRAEATHPGLSIQTDAGVWAVDATTSDDGGGGGGSDPSGVPVNYDTITIIDDFEGTAADAGWDEAENVDRITVDGAAEADRVGRFVADDNPSWLGAYADNTSLPAIPGYGQTPVSAWIRTDSFQDGEVALEIESSWNETSGSAMDNGYLFGARGGQAQWELFRVDNGDWTFLDNVQYDPGGDWTRVVWDYTDTGVHEIRLHDETDTAQASLSYADDTHQNLGFRVSGAFEQSLMDLVHFTDTELQEPPDDTTDATVIEDFESGRLSGWSSGTSDFTVNNYGYGDGQYSVRHNLQTGVGNLTSWPGDGLNRYPEEGERFRFYFRTNNETSQSFDTSVAHRVMFGYEDTENFYAATFELSNSPNPIYHVGERSNGTWSTYDVQTANHIPANTWIRCHVDWNTDRIGVRYWIDSTNEALADWSVTQSSSFSHSATSGGLRIQCVALDGTTQLTTDDLEIYTV